MYTYIYFGDSIDILLRKQIIDTKPLIMYNNYY